MSQWESSGVSGAAVGSSKRDSDLGWPMRGGTNAAIASEVLAVAFSHGTETLVNRSRRQTNSDSNIEILKTGFGF